jgi:hypothetical protein
MPDAGPAGPPLVSTLAELSGIESISVTADGSRIVVGMSDDNYRGRIDSGSAMIFVRGPSGWALEQQLGMGFADFESFGDHVAISGDGTRLAIARAPTGTTRYVHVYARTGSLWSQVQLITDGDAFDGYANAIALSHDGYTLAVARTSVSYGQVLVYRGDATHLMTLRATLAPEHTTPGVGYAFGTSIGMGRDGDVLVIGAPSERSAATGVDGDWSSDTATRSGAAYVFERGSADAWSQTTYLKASNTEAFDAFGSHVAISGDGDTVAVSAPGEDSAATGIDGDQSSNAATDSGAVYLFARSGGTWAQTAYVKPLDTPMTRSFSWRPTLSEDGTTMVGVVRGPSQGSVYVFSRGGGAWAQVEDMALPYTSVAHVSADGAVLAIGTSQSFGSGTTEGTLYVHTLP